MQESGDFLAADWIGGSELYRMSGVGHDYKPPVWSFQGLGACPRKRSREVSCACE
jgi:hypothetical protein